MAGGAFGEVVRHERQARGWDQAELAREVEVTQQTVSRWERGTSRPRRDVASRVARIFGLDPRVVLESAGYHDLGDRAAPALSVRPLATVLPVDQLAADRFEEFIAELTSRLYPDAHVSRFGGSGHKQHGFDVIGQADARLDVGIQCKRRHQFGKTDVQKAVKAATLAVAAPVIALSRVASPECRLEMLNHRGWTLWDKEDISRKVRGLPRDEGVRLIDTFFPGWREPFLGIKESGPWLTMDEFYGISTGALYTHDWPLVGRSSERAGVAAFLMGQDRVATIIGRGGLGKTRLLRAIAQDAEVDGWTVQFLPPGVELSPVDFERLSASGRLLVVIDDAHERSDLSAVFRGVVTRNADARVLVSIRPYGEGPLATALRQVGLSLSDVPRWELTDLSGEDAEALAQEALGASATTPIIRQLARLSADCPLVTVVGGVLIDRGQLDPACLDHEDTVRQEILGTFRDVLVAAEPLHGDPELRRSVLDGIAILQPFRTDQEEFRATLAGLVGTPYDRCISHIRALENAGVLLRRGAAVRVVPDLLGDVILAESCFDERSGTSTGYVRRSYEAALDGPRQHVFVNASRMDWQVRHDHRHAPSLTEQLWSYVMEQFDRSGLVGRRRITDLIRRVATFAPEKTLDFVRYAIDNPTEKLDPDLSDLERAMLELHPWNYDQVLHELPSLLRSVGYHYQHLPAALDTLWELARRDPRETNPYPQHAMRVIKDLAALQLGKPLAYNSAVVDAVDRWLLAGGDVG